MMGRWNRDGGSGDGGGWNKLLSYLYSPLIQLTEGLLASGEERDTTHNIRSTHYV